MLSDRAPTTGVFRRKTFKREAHPKCVAVMKRCLAYDPTPYRVASAGERRSPYAEPGDSASLVELRRVLMTVYDARGHASAMLAYLLLASEPPPTTTTEEADELQSTSMRTLCLGYVHALLEDGGADPNALVVRGERAAASTQHTRQSLLAVAQQRWRPPFPELTAMLRAYGARLLPNEMAAS
jgi:hypothetical protein